MGNPIVKATEIMDAKISFVSLVNKAANKRQFLITKAEDGKAQFQTYGSILMSEAETHYITGVVYEPMVEDAHKNYMTAEEIVKAEKYFSENSGSIDIQHSFEPEDNLSVVESWITKCDCTIGGKAVKKGAWLMTVKVEDDSIWEKVQKGEITGFSMGGVGKYSDEDVDLDDIEKIADDSLCKSERKSLIVKLANAFGYECVKKSVADDYARHSKQNNFWAAFNALESTLKRYNGYIGEWEYETDVEVIREALEEFSEIMTDILTSNNIQKAVVDTQPPRKKKSSSVVTSTEEEEDEDEKTNPSGGKSNQKTSIKHKKTEDKKMEKSELTAIIKSTVSEVIQEVFPSEELLEKKDKPFSDMTEEEIKDVIKSTVTSEIKKYANARGKATNIDSEEEEVEKSEEPEHYMHGIL